MVNLLLDLALREKQLFEVTSPTRSKASRPREKSRT